MKRTSTYVFESIDTSPGNFLSDIPPEAFGLRTLRLTSPMMKGEDVRWVQERIGATPDGIFGPQTQNHLQQFQQNKGITATGVTNYETWQALHSQSTPASGPAPGSPGEKGGFPWIWAAGAVAAGIMVAIHVNKK